MDTSEAGEGDLRVSVTHDYQQVPAYITHQRAGLYRVDFTPEGAGTYKVNVFYSDIEVRGRSFSFFPNVQTHVFLHGYGILIDSEICGELVSRLSCEKRLFMNLLSNINSLVI